MSQIPKSNHVIPFLFGIAILLSCLFVFRNGGVFLMFWGLFLLGMIPSIAIIGIFFNDSEISSMSKHIFKFIIVCQVVTILLPLLLFMLTFLFLDERGAPPFMPYMAFCVTGISFFCILASIIANIIYAITGKKSAFWGVLLQFAFAGAAFYAIYFGGKTFVV